MDELLINLYGILSTQPLASDVELASELYRSFGLSLEQAADKDEQAFQPCLELVKEFRRIGCKQPAFSTRQ